MKRKTEIQTQIPDSIDNLREMLSTLNDEQLTTLKHFLTEFLLTHGDASEK